MCIICVSKKGVRQPNETEIRTMFSRNPHGAGYMVAEPNGVRIEKGFMTVKELLHALRQENFTPDDVVVYHFRISTQAGVCEEMTQPFPLCENIELLKCWHSVCDCGIAHNGIIPCTTFYDETEYSDTALFVSFYLTELVKGNADLKDQKVLDKIEKMIHSKMVLLDKTGYIAIIGNFVEHDGLLFSNYTFEKKKQNYFTFEDVKRWRKVVGLDAELQGVK